MPGGVNKVSMNIAPYSKSALCDISTAKTTHAGVKLTAFRRVWCAGFSYVVYTLNGEEREESMNAFASMRRVNAGIIEQ